MRFSRQLLSDVRYTFCAPEAAQPLLTSDEDVAQEGWAGGGIIDSLHRESYLECGVAFPSSDVPARRPRLVAEPQWKADRVVLCGNSFSHKVLFFLGK